jgi:hypothetical protein
MAVGYGCNTDTNHAYSMIVGGSINQPCSGHAFIRMMQHGCASDDRIHTEVRETIFTEGYIYKWQAYVREVPNEAPRS